MRSTRAKGTTFRSTELLAPVPPLTTRRPLSSTKVRLTPKPRRLIWVVPLPLPVQKLLDCEPAAPADAGKRCSSVSTETAPELWMVSASMTVVGPTPDIWARLM